VENILLEVFFFLDMHSKNKFEKLYERRNVFIEIVRSRSYVYKTHNGWRWFDVCRKWVLLIVWIWFLFIEFFSFLSCISEAWANIPLIPGTNITLHPSWSQLLGNKLKEFKKLPEQTVSDNRKSLMLYYCVISNFQIYKLSNLIANYPIYNYCCRLAVSSVFFNST